MLGKGTAQLSSQMQSAGVEFELLGKSFAEGAALVRDFASGLNSVQINKDTLRTGKELIAILGLSGDEAGRLVMQFEKQNYSVKDLNDTFNQGAASAKAYGLPINDVMRDMRSIARTAGSFSVLQTEKNSQCLPPKQEVMVCRLKI